jgi:hypothetical protein
LARFIDQVNGDDAVRARDARGEEGWDIRICGAVGKHAADEAVAERSGVSGEALGPAEAVAGEAIG